jgi:transcriptional regulator with XRE-family HTH domain
LVKRAEATDKFVGQNIRLFRKAKGLSQTQLGDAIGVTFQQVQKYENGFNRVGSSRLVRIATALEVPVQTFFDGIAQERTRSTSTESVGDMLVAPYALDMLKALTSIPNPKVRRSLVALAESIGTQKRSERRR